MKNLIIKQKMKITAAVLAFTMILAACSNKSEETTADETASATEQTLASDTDDLFSERDYDSDYSEEDSIEISLNGNSASCDSSSVNIEDSVITICEEGSYIISGSLTDGMIIVDADDAKVQLVLDGADINSSDSAAIYVKQADKVFITLAEGSANKLTNGGEFVAIDDNDIDAVIFAKDDITLNGSGSLTIDSPAGHGITSKDELVITDGYYVINASSHALQAKDDIAIAGGSFELTAGKDAIHSENSDDPELGYIYITDGSFVIDAEDDGIHAESFIEISGGDISINSCVEGIEASVINISGGKISITASDDGINASDSSGTESMLADPNAAINISGGCLSIISYGDGIDSNGDLTITDGEIIVWGPVNGGNGFLDYNGNGSITGGSIVAAGASGMEMNFSAAEQGSILITTGSQEASSEIRLSDSEGNIILSYSAELPYSCVLVSAQEITTGKTYTLTAGSFSTTITPDSLLYGNGNTAMGIPATGFGGPQGGEQEHAIPNTAAGGEMPLPPQGESGIPGDSHIRPDSVEEQDWHDNG